MNFNESFQDFATKLGPTDLALYAGAGLVIWVLFQDKLGGVKSTLSNLLNNLLNKVSTPKSGVANPVSLTPVAKEDLFFQLVSSWKQTRDLAVRSGCVEAVKVADQMFPFLSPQGCKEKDNA